MAAVAMTSAVVPPEIAEFLAKGLIMYIGSRGPDLAPECVLATGARVEEGGRELTVWVPEIFAGATLANVRDNGQVTLTVVRVTDSRSIQLKGTYIADRPAGEDDRAHLDELVERRTGELALVGLPRSVSTRMVIWPAVALRMRATEFFLQTPGPRAGRPLDSTRDLG